MRTVTINVFLVLLGAFARVSTPAGVCPSSPLQVTNRVCIKPDFERPSLQKPPVDVTTLELSWKGPEHCVNNTCIFFSEHVGDGIALLTTERNAVIASNFPTVAKSKAKSLQFHAAEIPGKGIGIVADRKIRKGEPILTRTPTFMVQTASHVGLEPGTRDVLYDLAVHKLPSAGQELFMGQMGKDIYDKIETNCFQLYIDGANESGSHIGCYPEISRFNHDCRPNIHYRINNMTHTTVAARDIAPGEELTISYIELMLSREERRSRLRKWGFECSCSHCNVSDKEAAESDARLQKIAELESALENFNETVVTADTGAQAAALYEMERLHTYLGAAYTRAALNYALFGEEEKARVLARAAAEALEREFGPDSADARAMRVLAENPRKHWTWGKRRKANPTKAQ
ncbi:SET domain-containing protein [Hypoxylon rubiginosum]|uniref:SET domain-containing protein n=1 Tax=Hypoxylon rubiginosum TaxID=110542 RepID=A0ACC0CRX6_9PEZI|nr:SET domain-containing protein [Hypoxylon rubiginosum]